MGMFKKIEIYYSNMKKGKILPTFLTIMSIALVSAFEISDIFDTIGEENLILGSVFILTLFIARFAMRRFFHKTGNQEDGALTTVVSLILALATTYTVYKDNFGIMELLESIFSSDVMLTSLTIIILIGLFLLLRKFGFSKLLIGLGIALILSAIIFEFYEMGVSIIMGIILILIGLKPWRLLKKNLK
jgi:hypothetical protein